VINGLLETRVTDALNHVTKSRTDGAGRVRESEDQLSQVSTFSYDNNGNRVSFRDANNVGQDCVYDARNRDTQCTDTMGSVTKKFYDAHNNLVKTTDALLKDNLCAYDARDRKINCTDRLGGVTQYTYDLNNNLTTLTDAQNGVTSYVFDPRNLMTTETYPDTRSRTYTYDAIRRLIKRVDQTSTATGYIYDHAGRMIERVYSDNLNDAFVFDNASRLTSASSARYNNAVNRTYDSASRIMSETLTVGATPYSIGYSYDADNRQTHVTYPDGSVVARNFTDRNQLDVVTFNNALVANFNYDNAGRKVAANFGNGITETRTYQADNLNTAINTPGVTSFGYTWDANKRKLSQTETGIPLNNQTYSYDDEDRLASFNRNNGDNQTWNLSLVGDWNQFNNNGNVENRTHNAVHELTAVNVTPLTYDVKGNLTGNSNGQTYAWDIESRLTTATDSQNNTLGTYTYDALGRRVSKTVGALTTVFISDGLQKICEYENGTLARAYVYGSYIDEPLVMISGVNKYYYHSNNLYSVAALTDAAGTVIERYKYDPYGKATILAADGVTTRTASIVNNPFQYDGYYHDAETGLEFVNARYYSSDLGRFICRDPLGYVDGLHLYRGYFAPNGLDPLGTSDTWGWSWWDVVLFPIHIPFDIGAGVSEAAIKSKDATEAAFAAGKRRADAAADVVKPTGHDVSKPIMGEEAAFNKIVDATAAVASNVPGTSFTGPPAPATSAGSPSGASAAAAKELIKNISKKTMVRVYRAVSQCEYEQIIRTGKFEKVYNGAEGKYFADTLEGARAHGNDLEGAGKYHIMEADIPEDAASKTWSDLDGKGSARYVPIENLKGITPKEISVPMEKK
jgi:RHS repeat-associated protein